MAFLSWSFWSQVSLCIWDGLCEAQLYIQGYVGCATGSLLFLSLESCTSVYTGDRPSSP